jgi:hypothetical protein
MCELTDLIELWKRTIGDPPTPQQFELWLALHTPEVVRKGIIKSATKNLNLGGQMSLDRLVRFASSVMTTATEQAAEHALNRERMQEEMARSGS